MTEIDATHDPKRRSWVESANRPGTDFPIQNLPHGVFSPPGGGPRGGVAIGDAIFDLAAALELGLIPDAVVAAAEAAAGATLNAWMALQPDARRALRACLSELLAADGPARARIAPLEANLLHPAAHCRMSLPAAIGDYTDFYAGIHHATAVGRLMRPDNPLLPNYKHVPIGYHGRASSVRPSGMPVRRPNGQRKPAGETAPSLGPSRNLDYELELGIWIGPGNHLGDPIPIRQAARHIVGYCLLNDWSARDVQGWEYQPLGPFLAKSFMTTVSPWVVTAEALAPFRVAQAPRPAGDPRPLPYLWDDQDQRTGALSLAFDVQLIVWGRPAVHLSRSAATDLYWTPAQLVAHHTIGGCNLQPGDLFGSGTISGAAPGSAGSLLELTQGGRQPIALPLGETRRFLEDGDEVIFTARCVRDGFVPIGFGECRGRVEKPLLLG